MNRFFFYILFSLFITTVLNANNKTVYINTNKLKLIDFIKITSKAIDKTIILPQKKIKGDINLIQTGEVKTTDLYKILTLSLEQKGFETIEDGTVIKIVKKELVPKKISKKIQKKKANNVTSVFVLDNAKASNILKIIKPIIDEKEYSKKEKKPSITSDDESNSIVLIGQKDTVEYLKNIIKDLDKPRSQVYVHAKVIELSEYKTRDVGIKYGLDGAASGEYGLLSFAASLGGSSIAMNTASIGINIPDIKRGIALGASIKLLSSNGALDIVSEPSLLCINNKPSSIYIGQTKSIKTNSQVDSTGSVTSNTFNREDIGLKLSINPRILTNNKVVLDIQTLLEDVRTTTTNGQPDTSKKEIKTTAIVNSGESVIIGGLKKTIVDRTDESVPGLSDIPLIGGIFDNNTVVKDKINLVMVITPYIVPDSKDLAFITNELVKLQLLENRYTKDIEELYEKEKVTK